MVKVLALIFIVLLALASTAGYVVLDRRITAAEGRVAAGQGQLQKGRRDLAAGKARLDAGRKDASRTRKLFEFADERLDGGRDFDRAAELVGKRTDRQIAEGENQIAAGQKRLSAGEVSIRRGREQLRVAKLQRLGLGIGAAFFGSLALLLGFPWRRSPAPASVPAEATPDLVAQQQKASVASRILGWLLVLVLPGLVLSAYLFASRTTRHFSEMTDLTALAISVALGLIGVFILVRRWGYRILAVIVYVVLVGGGMYIAMVAIECATFNDCSSSDQALRWARVAWRELTQAWAFVASHV